MKIIPNMPASDYFADLAINKSSLDLIAKSPRIYKYRKENPLEPTPAMEFGSALHHLVLQPDSFDNHFVVAPDLDKRTTQGKQAFAEFVAEAGKRTVISKNDYSTMQGMRDSITCDLDACELLGQGMGFTEVSAFWQNIAFDTLIDCKGRADMIAGTTIVDLKTTTDASERSFTNSLFGDYRYAVQAAWYMDGFGMHQPINNFAFIAVEKSAPYSVAVYFVDDAIIEEGRKLYKRDLETYANCMQSNNWPGYKSKMLTLPKWYRSEV